MKPLLRFLYEMHYLVAATWRRLWILFLKEPMFRSQLEEVGATMVFYDSPIRTGKMRIQLGEGVMFGGGRLRLNGTDGLNPGLLIMGNHSGIGANTRVTVHQRVVLEDHAMVSFDCSISDADTADERRAQSPKPVHIGRYAWIGNGVRIYQGVTIGEGAIIGAKSVVANDIPPYCVALGNPAEVYFRNVGRPKTKQAQTSTTSGTQIGPTSTPAAPQE
ncbi:MAG: acyltransferase [Acidobacteriia bacterium]|nr:acyltransferase [Terriglobia bacterium]